MCPMCLTTMATMAAGPVTAAGGGLLAFTLTRIHKLKRSLRMAAALGRTIP